MHFAIILLLISFATTTQTTSIFGDIQLELTHIDHGQNLTKLELLTRAAHRSRARASLLHAMDCTSNPISRTNIPFHASGALEFVLELAIGTPPKPYPFLLDTGSGLIWTQCKPCSKCMKQPSPIFDPSKSSTFSHLSCSDNLCQALSQSNCTRNQCQYFYSYADQTYSIGDFARETFTLGTNSDVKVSMAIGCGHTNAGNLNNSSGIAGFSRDETSMVSQLGIPGFSYCMNDDINKRTLLKFGTQEEIFRDIKAKVQATKFVDPPPGIEAYAGLYFVSMTGITVGTKRLSIPKSVFDKAMIVDSGSTFTELPNVAYNKLKKALQSSTKWSPSNITILDLECFSTGSIRPSQVKLPKLIFHFPGMNLDIPRDNYIVDMDEKGVMCLAIMNADSFGIIGNNLQTNMQVLYDLKNSKLVIAPNQC
ncbi:Aspartic proteinase nepenthesin-1 [Rhynchospora pubera]|uniref:Aspartic proteinase nepenthesin-1 n=1 Tax=Rhynchospora pubera TaxID=906938 RepID=A0AAV8D129_9POAL|nr:Aspartic proteinase nepenthesin-1 [Rhynchospora pubera]